MKIHYLTFNLDLRVTVTRSPVPYTSNALYTYKVWSCYNQWLRRRCIYKKIQMYIIWPWSCGQGHTKRISIPPNKAATSNGLGGDAFTRKYIFWHLTKFTWSSILCDQCTCTVRSCYVKRLRRRYNYNTRDGRTGGRTDGRADAKRKHARTPGRLWTENNIAFFLKKKTSIITSFFLKSY